jgi:hypothetical protein
MLNFKTVSFQQLLDLGLKELVNHHHDEVETFNLPLDIDFDLYQILDERNFLVNIAVLNDEELVGYASFTISKSMHHKSSLWATDNFYYLKPEFRNGKNSLRLFDYCENILLNSGIDIMFLTSKSRKDNSRLFLSMGFEQNTQQFYKELKRS